MTETIEDRVKRGAELLDRTQPDWAARIAPDRLAMGDCSKCLLGQLYGHYSYGLEYLTCRSDDFDGDIDSAAIDHGFNLSDAEQMGTIKNIEAMDRRLAGIWRAEIRTRMAAAAGEDG